MRLGSSSDTFEIQEVSRQVWPREVDYHRDSKNKYDSEALFRQA
jgi:hypothetical protein